MASDYLLPKRTLAGKAKAKRPGTDVDRGQSIRNDLKNYVASAIASVRTLSDINTIIRTLMREDGLFSSAANSMVSLSVGAGFRLAGYDATGKMDLAVMSAAYLIVDKLDVQNDYQQGYNDKQDVATLLASLCLDVVGSGGCGAELVLDKELGPERLVPVGYTTITWESNGRGGRYPTQDNGEINLNFPTVFISELNRNSDEAYSVSPLRPGLAQTFQFNEFLEDTHRAVNRTGHSRLISTLDQEAVKQMAPPEVAADAKKMADFFNSVRASVEESISALEPEDALVSYDTVKHTIEDVGGSKADYSSLLTTLGNLLGVALKTPATISGLRSAGSEALSNAETLIYMKVVEASRSPVEEVMSRALTLAVRLMGVDGSVRFEFNPIDLRPETELEAYRASRQNRILQQLNYGMITDADACFQLGLRPQGLSKALAGTGFYDNGAWQEVPKADRSTSSGKAAAPSTPTKSGGRDNGR